MLFTFKEEFLVTVIFVIFFTVLDASSSTALAEENATDDEPQKTMTSRELLNASQEMDRLEAEIEKQQEFSKRPKRKFVGARTKDAQIALYMEKWRQRVEWAGNLNYPQEARDKQIYGKVQVTVSIKSNGELEGIEINKSSGKKILDDAVWTAVNKAAPFAPFDASMKEKIDILSITRTFNYTHQEFSITEDWVLTEIKKQINGK